MKNNEITLFGKNIKRNDIIISSISFLIFVELVIFIFMDGVGGWANEGVSGFIEQANLQKALGPWYQLIFYTVQVNLIFSILGMMWVFFKDQKWVQTMIFCFVSYLIFCVFALFVFNPKALSYNKYEAWKTLFLHLFNPLAALGILYLIRKDIVLDIKWLVICSLFLTYYWILAMIIHYNFYFTSDSHNSLAGQRLWIYGFMDFSKKIFFVPINNFASEIIINWIFITLTPTCGIALFILFKFIYSIKIYIPNNKLFVAI